MSRITPAVLSVVPISPTEATRDRPLPWATGWLGIRIAGMETCGFADVWLTPGRNARALFSVCHDDGEMYDMLEMRYARSRARVDLYLLLPGIAEAFGEKEASELSASELLPKSQRQPMRNLLDQPSGLPELFTRMAEFHSDVFHVLSAIYARRYLKGDPNEQDGPDRSNLWQPVPLESGIPPFAVEDGDPEPFVHPVTIGSVTGYFLDADGHHLFVDKAGADWAPLYDSTTLADRLTDAPISIWDLPPMVRQALLHKRPPEPIIYGPM